MSGTHDEGLAPFRAAQRLAYDCAEAAAAELRPGVTEREVAAKMARWLTERGATGWFHRPFVWFGERTALRFTLPTGFYPSGTRLEEGMPYILDVAPVVNGHPADIGYAGCLGENAAFQQLFRDLAGYRAAILQMVQAGLTLREVYEELDFRIEKDGYENRHRRYPGRVLGHRVRALEGRTRTATLGGFGVDSLAFLGREALGALRGGEPVLWSDAKVCDVAPPRGLWAIEPHVGFRGTAVKFEELLVIDEAGARWLDDDLPHVRRWRAAA